MEQIPLPYLLQQIPDVPKQLLIRGEFPDEEKYVFLSVIGSRKYTPYGKQAVETIIRGLAGYPIVIVSGLALGMDALAHEAALANSLKTIAVPGSGLDDASIYPARHLNLAHRILQSGGALVSEFEPGFKANKWSFPKRNRIMAGLSHAVLVIEAENKSGTRITARLATEYNREVFSVPGSIFSSSSDGTNQLIREGATPVTSAQDIIDFFGFENQNKLQQETLFENLSDQEHLILSLL
ncbi:MAG: DNA-processing protein DprA, partial [Candidatus Pacebacteria bacterium]|nr:DNA-processing protein DprA [Candidatus Paceibacterota bacterium]